MKTVYGILVVPLSLGLALGMTGAARAAIVVQCPGDADGDAVIDAATHPTDPRYPAGPYSFPDNVRCMHLAAGDGFINMADGRRLYMFGFSDATSQAEADVMDNGALAANFPAPTILADEGDQLYLTLSNVGMVIRPDLFDPHSVHWHGFPNAADIFDGLPESTISINMGASLTYYYNVVEPGTYMYHCHVEAAEHMQMGMLGNLYVRPAQNRLPNGTLLGSHTHSNPDNPTGTTPRDQDDPLDGDKYVYNDGDASTRYDVEYAIQIASMDPAFHDASETVQPLPFADMHDTYVLLNGRGYPDTINPNELLNTADTPLPSQKLHALVSATAGQRILLRISNLSITGFYTLASSLPMRVVGRGARILRGGGEATGPDLYYTTNSVTLGGGEAADVIIDTAGVPAGTYFVYTTNLNYLSNDTEDRGGMMTEVVIN